ncbi:TlpA family protein disulfide reductase [Sphingobacterium detergens]|uniref:Thioredoxin-like protein n=1 Tax=Sphingobacterium detergens TaxID=1145106 RepID=A0A420ARQ3_SPHD1|nr:TlpA disulfide reductase family protein [Sphingobacterium detergens]RKE47161.1 thioredoxin-like protein [Sphingobacterium detergens]
MKNLIITLCLALFFTSGLHGQTQLQNPMGYINLTIDYKGPVSDTIMVVMQNVLYPGLDNLHHRNIKADRSSGQRFFFQIPVEDSSGYLSIAKLLPEKIRKAYDLKGILTDYLWEIGDDVSVEISFPYLERPEWAEFTFNGKGSEKYKARKEVLGLMVKDLPYINYKDSTFHKGEPEAINKVLDILDSYAPFMSHKSFYILKADNFYERNVGKAISIINNSTKGTYKRKKLIHDFDSVFYNIEVSDSDKQYYKHSINFPSSYLSTLFSQTIVHFGTRRPSKVFNKIMKETDQDLREKLLVMFFFENFGDDSTAIQFKQALKIVTTKKYLDALKELSYKYEPFALGDYIFEDTEGKAVNLSSYKGKVVLIDLWFTGCGGCGYFYEHTVSKIEEDFKDNQNFKVISIGVDKRKETWNKGIGSGVYTSAEGAINLHVGKLGVRHPFIQDFNIPGMPCAILINKRGHIELFNTTSLYSVATLKTEINRLLLEP